MKIFIVLVLSCVSILGADTNTQVTTTTSIVGVRSDGIYRRDVFTRAGQTNLISDTWTKTDGTLATHMQSIYHDGLLVGRSMATSNVQNFITEAGSPCSVQFTFGSSKETGFVYISAKDGEILDGFTCTNGVYYPADSHLILEENERAKEFHNVSHFFIAH